MAGRLVAGVTAGFPDSGRRQAQAERDVGGTEQERGWAQSVGSGEVSGGQGGDRDRAVPSGLVEAHGQAAAGGADHVDLHDHGGGPGETLVHAQQHVGGHDPAPAGRPDQQRRDRQRGQPARDQHRLAAEPVGQGAGEEVRDRLDRAKRQDEREGAGESAQVEHPGGQQRHHRALLPQRPADERVDRDQQGELRQVGAQAEPNPRAGGGRAGCARRG